MTVKLDTGVTPFNPNPFPNQENYDPLGSYISHSHRIIAELMPTPNGEKLWEVQCVRCKHGYLTTLSKDKPEQPCKCSMRHR